MLIDMHLHTLDHSPDSLTSARQIAEMAIAAGLDGIVLTDHDYTWHEDELTMLRAEMSDDLLVLSGAEICFSDVHILVYGVPSGPVPNFSYPENVIQWVDDYHGAAVIAHPFGPDTIVSEDTMCTLGAHGCEAFNGRRKCMDLENIFLLERLGLSATGGTDFHGKDEDRIGRCATEFSVEIRSIEDVVNAIRRRLVLPWRARNCKTVSVA